MNSIEHIFVHYMEAASDAINALSFLVAVHLVINFGLLKLIHTTIKFLLLTIFLAIKIFQEICRAFLIKTKVPFAASAEYVRLAST